jgi:calcineurin-like phosphoesterase
MLPSIKKEFNADIVIANGENSATGNGVTPNSARFLFDSGVDVITLGNHTLKRPEISDYLDETVDMYRVKCAKTANVNENELSNYFNYKGKEWLITNASRDCKKISIESLRSALDVLSNADEMMKSTSIDKNLLLEETVAKLLMLRNM